MAELVSLREGVEDLVRDGDAVAIEGFTHLIPFAAGGGCLYDALRLCIGVEQRLAVSLDA